MLPPFDLLEPRTLDEALEAIADGGQPLAGGTNLFPDIRARGESGGHYVSLIAINGLRYIDYANGRISVGARTTISDLMRDSAMTAAAPALVTAAEVFGGAMIRNAATIGGNLCYGSPSADTVPPLLTLDAEVTLVGTSGERTLPLDEFYLDYKKTVLKPGELMTAISWAVPDPNSVNLFYKLGRRRGDAITITGVAVMIAAEDGKCTKARIALGSVAPTVFRAKSAEAVLEGQALCDRSIDAAARNAADECSPIDDIRASAQYRRHTAHSLVRRLVTKAWKQIA